tara:strand:+ start:1442 stop:2107 length:666 start_codon:yes stop_codon:yes gene_type:complete
MASVIQNFKDGFDKLKTLPLSLTNQYQVTINGFTGGLKDYLFDIYNLPNDYATGNSIGIMCSEAVLPGSSFATLEISDNYQGIKQHVPHFRNYIDSEFSFYVDAKHQTLKFFEGWMDYISGDNSPKTDMRKESYYRRFNYPMDSSVNFASKSEVGYKCQTLSIVKFDKNANNIKIPLTSNLLEYQFINAFPKALNTSPVSYGQANLMKVTVTFAYDRYVMT